MPRILSIASSMLIVAVVVAGPWAYSAYKDCHYRNFHVVKEGTLYRSGQITLEGLKRLIHDYRIKTVITLRAAKIPGQPHPALEEEEHCRSQGTRYYRIPPRSWWLVGDRAPGDIGVDEFHKIMQDPAHFPVLLHCFAGMHRTGTYCAIYRMEFEGWSNDQAIAEMKALGYDNIDHEWDVLGYLEHYRPRCAKRGQPSTDR